jgi:hypothetical protein
MDDQLHELMTGDLAVYWGLGTTPYHGSVSSGERSHIAVGAVHVFLDFAFPLASGDQDIPLDERIHYVNIRKGLKALSDQFS